MSPKISILTAVHKRPEVFREFLKGLEVCLDWDVDLIVVGDDQRLKQILKDNSPLPSRWVNFKNKPLGAKFNAGLQFFERDYLLVSGSDNLFSRGVFEIYEQAAKEGVHFVGFLDYYLRGLETGITKYFPGYRNSRKGHTIGAGRLLHKNLIAALNGKLWDDNLNRALDLSMDNLLSEFEYKSKVLSCKKEGVVVLDLKTKDNIWGLDDWPGEFITDKLEI